MSRITKKALAASLVKMLEKTTLDKITVKELAEDCGVNRQTFYYHFQDIYDLLEWIFRTETEAALRDNSTYDAWQQGYLQVFKKAEENKQLVLNAYHSLGREYLEQYLCQLVYRFLFNVVQEIAQGMNVAEEDKKFIANFYKLAFSALLLDWIRGGMKERPEDIVERLAKLISGDFRRALEKYEKK